MQDKCVALGRDSGRKLRWPLGREHQSQTELAALACNAFESFTAKLGGVAARLRYHSFDERMYVLPQEPAR